MPDDAMILWNTSQPPAPVTVTQADGWVITLCAGEKYFQHDYHAEWADALDCYQEPPRGWQAIAISACKDGVPFAKLDAHTIAELRSGSRRDAKADARHVRDYIGKASL